MDATDKLENCEPLEDLRLQQKPQRPGSRAFASSATPWIPRRGWCRRACLVRWDTHRGIFLATERARKQIKLKKGEENTKNVKRWGWTPVGSGLGIYFLVNAWMNGWNTFIFEWSNHLMSGQKCGISRHLWGGLIWKSRSSGSIWWWNPEIFALLGFHETPRLRGNLANLQLTRWDWWDGFSCDAICSWGDEGKRQRHDPFAATLLAGIQKPELVKGRNDTK